MYIVCINNEDLIYLTVYKKYFAIVYHYDFYYIKNDIGRYNFYKPDRFITLDEYREKQLDNLKII